MLDGLILILLWVGGAIFVGFLFNKFLPTYGGWGMGIAALVFSPPTGLLAFLVFLGWKKLFKNK